MAKIKRKYIVAIVSVSFLLALSLIGSFFYQIYQFNKAVNEHNISYVEKVVSKPYGKLIINLPKLDGDSFNDVEDIPQYPLQVAVHNADYEMVKLLVESGADINCSPIDSPPLICYGLESYKKGEYKCIKYLIDNGAINHHSNVYFEGQEITLSIMAAMFGGDEIITDDEIEKEGLKTYKLIVSKDKLRDDKDVIYELNEAIFCNHYYIVEEILKTHPIMNLNKKQDSGAYYMDNSGNCTEVEGTYFINSLNYQECNKDTIKIAKLLIKNGADTKYLNSSKEEIEEDMTGNDIPKKYRDELLEILFGE